MKNKMFERFSKEDKILNHLILHCLEDSNLGLLNGQMGTCIVLAHYARTRKISNIENVSEYILNKILKELSITHSIDFANGLCGIGWGIEYLIQNGHMDACGVDILEEVDQKIMQTDILFFNNWSLEKGLIGMLHYILAHLQGANKDGKKCFCESYLLKWEQVLIDEIKISPHNITLNILYQSLNRGLKGECSIYEFNLLKFIETGKRIKKNNLSLRTGYAGQLEKMLSHSLIL